MTVEQDAKSAIEAKQQITVLGSTGSIGLNTLDVLQRHPEQFTVFALTANTNSELLEQQCRQFSPQYAVLRDELSAEQLRENLGKHGKTEVLSGEQALVDVAGATEVDIVMAAIVGAAGLLPTLAAVQAGKKVLLANKETLVMAGQLFIDAVKQHGAVLLPIDSEHNAIFQCLPIHQQVLDNHSQLSDQIKRSIRKILLTGSGGPFRQWSQEQMANASPEQACNHPNWSMGKKISVDSATLMNKGLEFIEARWLFDVSPSDIQVLIHPQSIIHSMVEYIDGSVLAQLGHPDMRTPIAHALAWPNRIDAGVGSLNWTELLGLTFETPDFSRFPALKLAMNAASMGSGAAVVLNAVNEVAVDAFLKRHINFIGINQLLEHVMSCFNFWEPDTIDAVLDLDSAARHSALELLKTVNDKNV